MSLFISATRTLSKLPTNDAFSRRTDELSTWRRVGCGNCVVSVRLSRLAIIPDAAHGSASDLSQTLRSIARRKHDMVRYGGYRTLRPQDTLALVPKCLNFGTRSIKVGTVRTQDNNSDETAPPVIRLKLGAEVSKWFGAVVSCGRSACPAPGIWCHRATVRGL